MRPRDDTNIKYGPISIFVFLLLLLSCLFSIPSGSGTDSIFATVNGNSPNDQFGHNVSGIGDFNWDGYDDIIVGAPGVNGNTGKAYIFFGGPWFNGSLSADSANVTINGSISGDLFGWDVSDAGNVNNDNFDDVIIGAPGNNSGAGVAYIFHGGNSPPRYMNANDADVILIGESSGDQFGFSVSSAGNVNNDNFDDIIVGAFGNNSHTGSAHIFFGSDAMSTQIDVSDANVTFFGEDIGDRFGFSVAGAGDVNDDNFDDVVVGAPGADKAYIYFGGNPMNAWVQTSEADFNSGKEKVHMNLTSTGEVKLESFNGIKAMMTYYNGSATNTPRIRTWNQTEWNSWSNAGSFGSDENQWFIMESGSVRKNEKILAISDNGNDLNVQVYNGFLWSPILNLNDLNITSNLRCFDVAYEVISGDAMITYYNKSSGDKFPKYRIWNGTSWTNEMNTSKIGTDDINWIVLTSAPNSNEILMVTLNSTNGIWAQVWDGDANMWGNSKLLESTASITSYQCFDAVYESQSEYGFIAWADGTDNLRSTRWKGDWSDPIEWWGGTSGTPHYIKIASEPNTNYILGAVLDSFTEINANIWDGTSWGVIDGITTNAKDDATACFDVAWESRSDREGLIVYAEGNDAPMYKNVSGTIIDSIGQSTLDANPFGTGDPSWITLKSDTQSDEIMMLYIVFDGGPDVNDIGVVLWNGTEWINAMNVDMNSTWGNASRFDLAYTDTSGYFVSSQYDAKIIAPWGRIWWTADIPIGTTLQIRTRTSYNGLNWSSWSNWSVNGDRITSPDNRWIQYQAWFETTNISSTPTLNDVTIELSHADLVINGTSGENFGWSVSWAGDLNLDNYDDIIIGAPQNNSGQGTAYIFQGIYLTSESALDRYIDLTNGDTANNTLIGDTMGDKFGYSVSWAGNFSKDGYHDVVVGAPGALDNGSIFVFFGGPSMNPIITAFESNFTLIGENIDDSFGWSVSWAGNVDDDSLGYEEIIVGSPYFDDGATDSGKIYVIHLYHQPDLLINGSDNDLYQDVPSGAQVNLSYLDPGTNTSWWIVLQNDGELDDTIQFNIASNMLFNWSWELRENSTWARITDGEAISLAKGEQMNLTLNISAPIIAVNGDESWVEIYVSSQNDTPKTDSVKAIARTIDITKPKVLNTTIGTPTTGDTFSITAQVTDNILVDSVHLYYWFDLLVGTDGPYNVTMDPGYIKDINIPINATTLHFNISAKDTSGNWNETGIISMDVRDNDLPTITHTTTDLPKTGDPFNLTAYITDNIGFNDPHLYFWFETGSGDTPPQNLTMTNLGNGNFSILIDVPIDAFDIHFNISVNDTNDLWNETGEDMWEIWDNDEPNLNDTTNGIPMTGEPFIVTANATDNHWVEELHIYYWFESTSGDTMPQNVTMTDLGSGNYNYTIIIPSNSLILHYNISATDYNSNWNETGEQTLDVTDDDIPEIADISANPPSQEIGHQVNISANITDNIGIDGVSINISLTDGGWVNESMNYAGNDGWYYIAAFNEPGQYNFTIYVIDINGFENQSEVNSFNLTPHPPTVDYIRIRSEPDGEGVVLSSLTYNLGEVDKFYAAGYNNTFEYLWDVEVNWFNTNIAAGSISPPSSIGTSTNFSAIGLGQGIIFITLDLLNYSATYEVITSQSPKIDGIIPNIPLLEDFGLYQLVLTGYASDPQDSLDELKWFLTGVNNSIISIGGENQAGNHIIHFASKNDMYGNMEVTYWLEDPDGNHAFQKAWINVSPDNDAPKILDCPDELIVHYDSPYSFDYSPYIFDIDNPLSDLVLTSDEISYTSVSGFIVTYIYPQDLLGETDYVTLTLSDGLASDSKLIRIKVTSDYPPELVKTIPDVTLEENQTLYAEFDLDEYIIDQDGDGLEFTHTATKINITINPDHTVDFSAKGEWSGVERVTFRAKDSAGAIVEQTITVTVTPVNDPPVIKPLPLFKIHFNSNFTFDLRPYISDTDNKIEDLVITTSNPDNVTVNGTLITLCYPEKWGEQNFPYEVLLTVYVSDGIFSKFQITSVHVSDNYPPELMKTLDDQVMFEDKNLTGAFDLDEYFRDWDGVSITYSSTSSIITVRINADNTVDLIPPANWFGTEFITLRATDDDGAFIEDSILVTVFPENDPPQIREIPQQEGIKGQEWILDLSDYIYDIDTDLANLTITVNGSYVKVVGHVLIFNYPENMSRDTIWITVSDGESNTTTKIDIILKSPEAPTTEEGLWLWIILPIILAAIIIAFIILRRGIYTVEDLFLITKSGLLIEHAGTTRDYEKGDDRDEDILAGMFVAVQEFIRDSFGGEEEEHLKRLDYGDKTVLIYRGDHIILAAFLAGLFSKPFYRKMKMFVEDVEEHYEGEVEEWSGDIADLPDIELKLHSLLEGNYPLKNMKNMKEEDDDEEEEEDEEDEEEDEEEDKDEKDEEEKVRIEDEEKKYSEEKAEEEPEKDEEKEEEAVSEMGKKEVLKVKND